jgi:hypothetical protein
MNAFLLRLGLGVALALAVASPAADPADPKGSPAPDRAPDKLALPDQYDRPQSLAFPHTNVVVLLMADRGGSEEIDGWVTAMKSGRVELRGLADVREVPWLFQGRVRKKFQEQRKYPVMMDWSGTACVRFGLKAGVANVLVLGRDGRIEGRWTGAAKEAAVREASQCVERALARPVAPVPSP